MGAASPFPGDELPGWRVANTKQTQRRFAKLEAGDHRWFGCLSYRAVGYV